MWESENLGQSFKECLHIIRAQAQYTYILLGARSVVPNQRSASIQNVFEKNQMQTWPIDEMTHKHSTRREKEVEAEERKRRRQKTTDPLIFPKSSFDKAHWICTNRTATVTQYLIHISRVHAREWAGKSSVVSFATLDCGKSRFSIFWYSLRSQFKYWIGTLTHTNIGFSSSFSFSYCCWGKWMFDFAVVVVVVIVLVVVRLFLRKTFSAFSFALPTTARALHITFWFLSQCSICMYTYFWTSRSQNKWEREWERNDGINGRISKRNNNSTYSHSKPSKTKPNKVKKAHTKQNKTKNK